MENYILILEKMRNIKSDLISNGKSDEIILVNEYIRKLKEKMRIIEKENLCVRKCSKHHNTRRRRIRKRKYILNNFL